MFQFYFHDFAYSGGYHPRKAVAKLFQGMPNTVATFTVVFSPFVFCLFSEWKNSALLVTMHKAPVITSIEGNFSLPKSSIHNQWKVAWV